MSLTRDIALKALEQAFDARMEAEFRNLADPYSGTSRDKSEAQENFINGLRRSRDAFDFAEAKINELFAGET